jgi:hypothetical protein
LGISLKRFHGWEPATAYEFDAGGVLVVSRPEVEWDESEQTVMLALHQYRNSLCPKCGGPLDKCTDPANEMKYTAGLPIRCHATTARGKAAEPYRDQPGFDALMFVPTLRD